MYEDRTNRIKQSWQDSVVKVDLGGFRNIYSISVLFKNYNEYCDYNSLWNHTLSFVHLCSITMQILNPSTMLHLHRNIMDLKKMFMFKWWRSPISYRFYRRTFQHCYLFLTFISNLYWFCIHCTNYNFQKPFCSDLETRQQGRFAGSSLYVSKTGDLQGPTLCHKDGPHLPPLNFTTICEEYGRYVIYYNERLNGVSYPEDYVIYSDYTELCKVSVTGNRCMFIKQVYE